jgi:hypothetical protein
MALNVILDDDPRKGTWRRGDRQALQPPRRAGRLPDTSAATPASAARSGRRRSVQALLVRTHPCRASSGSRRISPFREETDGKDPAKGTSPAAHFTRREPWRNGPGAILAPRRGPTQWLMTGRNPPGMSVRNRDLSRGRVVDATPPSHVTGASNASRITWIPRMEAATLTAKKYRCLTSRYGCLTSNGSRRQHRRPLDLQRHTVLAVSAGWREDQPKKHMRHCDAPRCPGTHAQTAAIRPDTTRCSLSADGKFRWPELRPEWGHDPRAPVTPHRENALKQCADHGGLIRRRVQDPVCDAPAAMAGHRR